MFCRGIFILTVLFISSFTANATHLVGGSLSYEFMGKIGSKFKYKVSVSMYRDALQSNTQFDQTISIGVYEANANNPKIRTIEIDFDKEIPVNPLPGNPNCNFNPNVNIMYSEYEKEIFLESTSNGYHLAYLRCCRNDNKNLIPDMGQTYHAYIPPTSQANSSPQFSGVPAPYICRDDTINILHKANDPDGDSLAYKLVHPYSGANAQNPKPLPSNYLNLPFPNVTYKQGYGVNNPFGSNGLISINNQTGLTNMMAPKIGLYAIAVEVSEYRNGQLLSSVRRDVQMIVLDCPNNPVPQLSTPAQSQSKKTNYTINAGDSLGFHINYQDQDSMYFNYSGGGIFGSNGVIDTPYANLNQVQGKGSINTKFNWNTGCHQGRKSPYTFVTNVIDDGCPSKEQHHTFSVEVKPFNGVSKIDGLKNVCSSDGPKLYKANTQSHDTTDPILEWMVTGGTIQNINKKEGSALIQWDSTGTNEIAVVEKNRNGCIGDTATKQVAVYQQPSLEVKPDTTICSRDTISVGTKKTDSIAQYDWVNSVGVLSKSSPQTDFAYRNYSDTIVGKALKLKMVKMACEVTDTLTIKVKPEPLLPSIQGASKLCINDTADYEVAHESGLNYDWEIEGGKKLLGDSAISKIFWNKPDSGLVKLSAVNKFGCVSEPRTKNVFVDKPTINSINGRQSVCPNSENIQYWVDSLGNDLFQWSVQGGAIADGANSNNIKVNWGGPGNGYLQVYKLNRFGCLGDTAKMNVDIGYELNTPPIEGDTAVCEFSKGVPYEVMDANGSEFHWKLQSGTIQNPGKKHQITVDWGSQGKGWIQVYETAYDSVNNKTCNGDTTIQPILINRNPETKNLMGPEDICPNETASFSVDGFDSSSFEWNIMEKGILTDSSDEVQVQWANPGDYEAKVREWTQNGCSGEWFTTSVTVHPNPGPKAIEGLDTVCFPNDGITAYQYNGMDSATYEWSIEHGEVYQGQGESHVKVDWLEKGQGQIRVQETSRYGCKGKIQEKPILLDSLAINLNYVTTLPDDDSRIKVNWNASGDPERAYGFQLHKQTSLQEQVNTYALSRKDSSFVDDHVLTNQHSYEYRISGTNACGRPITSNSHASILLNGTKNQSGIRLDWQHYKGWEQNGIQTYKIARAVNDENQNQVYKRLRADQTNEQLEVGLDGYHQCYRIIAEQRAGNAQSWSNKNCFDFEAKVHIPNAFSPNEDMINDQYMIEGYNLKEFRIRIYNRWGEEVFSSQSLDEVWDGTYKGQEASPGKYIVLIKYRGNSEIQSYEGLLHLIR